MKWRTIVVAAMIALIGWAAGLSGEPKEDESTILAIQWQRLVDKKGETCDRCGGTEKELRRAVTALKRSLRPLGMKVTLEKISLEQMGAEDIINSNRISIAGRTLEDWLGAKVGTSACGSCCAKLGETVECRTTTLDGNTYEVIPARLIVKAGLKAASEVMKAPEPAPCCPSGNSSRKQRGKCCSSL
jgi:hypothetical protein